MEYINKLIINFLFIVLFNFVNVSSLNTDYDLLDKIVDTGKHYGISLDSFNIKKMYKVNLSMKTQIDSIEKLLKSNKSSFLMYVSSTDKFYTVGFCANSYYYYEILAPYRKLPGYNSLSDLISCIDCNSNHDIYMFSDVPRCLFANMHLSRSFEQCCNNDDVLEQLSVVDSNALRSKYNFINKINMFGAKVITKNFPTFTIVKNFPEKQFVVTDNDFEPLMSYDELFKFIQDNGSKIFCYDNFNDLLKIHDKTKVCSENINNKPVDHLLSCINGTKNYLNIDKFTSTGRICGINMRLFALEILRLTNPSKNMADTIMVYLPKNNNKYLCYVITRKPKILNKNDIEFVLTVKTFHTISDNQGHTDDYVYEVPIRDDRKDIYIFANTLLQNLNKHEYLYLISCSDYSESDITTYDLSDDRLSHGSSFWESFTDCMSIMEYFNFSNDYTYAEKEFKQNYGTGSFFIPNEKYFENAYDFKKSVFVKQEGSGGCWFSAMLGLLNAKKINPDPTSLKLFRKEKITDLYASDLSLIINSKINHLSLFDTFHHPECDNLIAKIIESNLLSNTNLRMFREIIPGNNDNMKSTIFDYYKKLGKEFVINSMDDHVVLLVDMPNKDVMTVEEWGIRYTISTDDFLKRLKATFDYDKAEKWYVVIYGLVAIPK